MKKLLCLILALLLTGCAAAPAETEPTVSGSLRIQYQQTGALVECNGQTLETDAVEEDGWLDCARLTVLMPGALRIDFGENRFLFLGDLSKEQQKQLARNGDVRADIVQLSGEVSQELLTAAAPNYVMVPEKTGEAWAAQYEVFDHRDFGLISAESDGTEILLSWSLSTCDSVTAAQ